jgi:hypothetical protein
MRVDDRQTGIKPFMAGPDPARPHRTEPIAVAGSPCTEPATKVDNRQTKGRILRRFAEVS